MGAVVRDVAFWFFVLLIVMSAANIAVEMRAQRHRRELARTLARVEAFLTVWATHWGEPDRDVRELLMQIVRKAPR